MIGLPQLTAATYESVLREDSRLIMIVFRADWCPLTERVAEIAAALAGKMRGKLAAASVHLEHEPEIARRFGVAALPRTMFTLRGEVVGSIGGLHMPSTYERAISSLESLTESDLVFETVS